MSAEQPAETEQLAIYDPKVPESQIAADLASGEGTWQSVDSPVEAVVQADAVLILTEWDSFADLNWQQLVALMRKPAWLFDARSIADLSAASAAGLNIWRIGCG